MEEKVIREFQVIETEEGYRIEMKGDKEALRRMLFGGRGRGFGAFRPPMPPMPPEPPFPGEHFGQRHAQHHAQHGRHMGEHGQSRWSYDLGPWWDEGASGDSGTDESAAEA